MKKTMTVVLLALLSLLFAISCDTEKTTDGYEVGDKGPSGGLIVYVNPNAESDGWTYLEAAPSDAVKGEDTTFMFGYYFNDGDLSGSPDEHSTEDGIGKGKSNTTSLLETENKRSPDNSGSHVSNFAPRVASEYTTESVSTGWFLPSLAELEKVWVFKTELGMNAETYLSSSESEYSVYVVSTKDNLENIEGNNTKINAGSKAAVRCVRTF